MQEDTWGFSDERRLLEFHCGGQTKWLGNKSCKLLCVGRI